jgi:molybdate transport system substrate-binding protein
VAAAADLAVAFGEIGAAYEKERGHKVVFSFAASGLLAKQLAEGAPFDVFAAASGAYADEAIRAGACQGSTRVRYARGQLVLWTRAPPAPASLAALAEPRYARIAVANPAHAPYGQAALEALIRAGLAEKLKPRLVYGENVQQALQFVQSGNADVGLVARSLAASAGGSLTVVPESAHSPIEQVMVACGKDATRLAAARAFIGLVTGPAGRTILERHGLQPGGP